jgi:hypothetical protein
MVQLTPKEQALVDRVIQKIQEFDPQARCPFRKSDARIFWCRQGVKSGVRSCLALVPGEKEWTMPVPHAPHVR